MFHPAATMLMGKFNGVFYANGHVPPKCEAAKVEREQCRLQRPVR